MMSLNMEPPRAGIRSVGGLCKIINNVNKIDKNENNV